MSIEKAAKKYSDNWGEQSAFETGGYSDAAKQYWYEQFKAQEQNIGDWEEKFRDWITNHECNIITGAFDDVFIKMIIVYIKNKILPKAQEQKPITNEEIEALAENIPKELGWSNDGTAEPNDIKRAFIKGFKAALNHK